MLVVSGDGGGVWIKFNAGSVPYPTNLNDCTAEHFISTNLFEIVYI